MPRTLATAAAVSALLLGAAVAPSFAQVTQPESRVVHYEDLDLYSDAGADTLIRRVRQAADAVCGDHVGRTTLTENRNIDACEVTTTQYAIEDIAHPVVTARYYGYSPEIVIEGSWDPDPYYSYEVKPYYDPKPGS